MLNNIAHIKAFWIMQGIGLSQLALDWGCETWTEPSSGTTSPSAKETEHTRSCTSKISNGSFARPAVSRSNAIRFIVGGGAIRLPIGHSRPPLWPLWRKLLPMLR